MNQKANFRLGFVKADHKKDITVEGLMKLPRSLQDAETPENSTMFSEVSKNSVQLPEMLSIKEASERTNLSYDFIRYLIGKGFIKYVRSGKKFLVNASSLAEYLNHAMGNGVD